MMTDLGGDVTVIVQDVWASFLSTDHADLGDLVPLTGAMGLAGTASTVGAVRVAGAWTGAVVVECTPALARGVAAVMFLHPEADVSAADVRDALGEVVNMIGGNVKSLLPAPSELSLPDVASGVWPAVLPDAELVSEAGFVVGGQPIRVTVWSG